MNSALHHMRQPWRIGASEGNSTWCGIPISLDDLNSTAANLLEDVERKMKTEDEEQSPTSGGILKVSKTCGSLVPRQNQSDSELDQSSRGMDQARVGHCHICRSSTIAR